MPPSRKAGFKPRIFSRLRLARLFVLGDRNFGFSHAHADGRDLAGEAAVADGLLRPCQRGQRIIVLGLAGELVGLGAILGEGSHQAALVIGVFEPVEEHVVDDLAMAEPVAAARAVEQIGRVGHALHAARHRDFGAAGEDQVMGEHRGLHAGAAHLVDRGGAGGRGQSRAERRLARGRLALPRGQHAAEHDFVDLVGRDPGALQRRLDRRRAERRRGEVFQIALESAHGGAGRADDDDGV